MPTLKRRIYLQDGNLMLQNDYEKVDAEQWATIKIFSTDDKIIERIDKKLKEIFRKDEKDME